ncbi:MAG TPA: prolipoprotein diacylglyceryl transferase [Deltaproteobacteria bacterium]|nr:prolipoprotein diacylglyceryl transferase [Deltaproteobacteria bacterium]
MPAVLQFPQIDPFLFRIGSLGLSWYAFMYLLGFVSAYFLLRYRQKKGLFRLPQVGDVSLLITYCFYGLILGARLGYILFYNLEFYLAHPWEIPALWHGGMSFHGGLIGTLIAMGLFARRMRLPYFHVSDNVGLCAPLGLGFGRIGNFINGELYGRPSQVPWAMVFPRGGPEARHPSQLYEALLEGPILFLIIYLALRFQKRDGVASAMLLIAYGTLRFIVEFFREPDPQLGTVLGPFSMGQLLSLTMILGGLATLAISRAVACRGNIENPS